MPPGWPSARRSRRWSPSCRSSTRITICGNGRTSATCCRISSPTCDRPPHRGHGLHRSAMRCTGRPGRGDAPGRRDRIRRRHRGDERQRRLRPDADRRRHRRLRRPDAGRPGGAGAGGAYRAPAAGVSAACGIPPPGMPTPSSATATRRPGLLAQRRFPRRVAAARPRSASLRPLGLPSPSWPRCWTWRGPVPTTNFILGHCGGPLGYGPYAGKRDAVFADWRAAMAELARLPECRGQARRHDDAAGGLRLWRAGDAAELRRAGGALGALYRHLHRAVRRRALPVREQLPCGEDGHRLRRDLERLQAHRRRAPRPTEKRALFAGTAARFYRL